MWGRLYCNNGNDDGIHAIHVNKNRSNFFTPRCEKCEARKSFFVLVLGENVQSKGKSSERIFTT